MMSDAWKFNYSHLFMVLMLFTFGGCSSLKGSFLAVNSLPAIKKTERLARSKFDCSDLTAYILSSEEREANALLEKKHAAYTIQMSGCEKQAIYYAACHDPDDCTASEENPDEFVQE